MNRTITVNHESGTHIITADAAQIAIITETCDRLDIPYAWQDADCERRMTRALEDASLVVAWDDETGEPIFKGEVR